MCIRDRLHGAEGRILALSQRAFTALTPEQLAIIERSAQVVALDVPTIERAGGSVRCMIAGIHLESRFLRPPAAADAGVRTLSV